MIRLSPDDSPENGNEQPAATVLLQLTFRGLAPTEAAERLIRARSAAFERRGARVVQVTVAVEPRRGRHAGRWDRGHVPRVHRVRLVVALLDGRRIDIRSRAREQLLEAIGEAFRGARRAVRSWPQLRLQLRHAG